MLKLSPYQNSTVSINNLQLKVRKFLYLILVSIILLGSILIYSTYSSQNIFLTFLFFLLITSLLIACLIFFSHLNNDISKFFSQISENFTNQLNNSVTHIEETHKMFRIANWSYNIKNKQFEFSDELLNILEIYDRYEISLIGISKLLNQDFLTDLPYFYNKISNDDKYEFNQEIDLFTNQGAHKWVHVIANKKTNPQGEIIIFGIAQDITLRKEKDMIVARLGSEVKVKSEEALRAAHSKSVFLANMSHEIRTPLNGIVGITNILESTPLNDEQRKYIEIINHSSESLLTIINDILDFSKIESKKMTFHYANFELSSTVNEVMELIKGTYSDKSIEIKTSIDPQISKYIHSDATRLRQILLNLLGNSFKFTEKGKIELDIKLSKLIDHKNQLIEFHIRDTGIGISEEGIKKLFTPFAQDWTLRKTTMGGTGLGLTITKELIEGMGGTIWVESIPGTGSTFSFTLNADIAEGVQGQSTPNINQKELPLGEMYPVSIIVAEDNEVNKTIIIKMLESIGFKDIAYAANGAEVLTLLSNKKFDLIMMDMQMPIMDGVEATEKIRANKEIYQPKIVALTANAFQDDAKKCFDAGMDEFLTKPFKIQKIKDVIIKLFNKN